MTASSMRPSDGTKQSATDRTIDEIVELIAEGDLVPGERLPPEPHLAARMEVSRGSLREAVRVLVYLGILDTRVGDGTYVTDLTGERLIQPLDLMGRVANAKTVLEIFEIRRSLESTASGLAAMRATTEQIEALRAQLERLDNATDTAEFVALDIGFHDMIAEASGNASLRMLCRSFSAQTQRTRLLRGANVVGILSRSTFEHHEIFRYIEAREPSLASAAATAHVASVEHWLRAEADTTDGETVAATDDLTGTQDNE